MKATAYALLQPIVSAARRINNAAVLRKTHVTWSDKSANVPKQTEVTLHNLHEQCATITGTIQSTINLNIYIYIYTYIYTQFTESMTNLYTL